MAACQSEERAAGGVLFENPRVTADRGGFLVQVRQRNRCCVKRAALGEGALPAHGFRGACGLTDGRDRRALCTGR
jgi:hypothetical protein